MFGNRLIRETHNVVFQDPAFRTDLVNLLHNCTKYHLDVGFRQMLCASALGRVEPKSREG
jgi:conjugal transfer mating pair stabilization protein TraG